MVGPKFRRAGTSMVEWRRLDDFIIKNQRAPRGTGVEPVRVGDTDAEWVRAPAVIPDRAVLLLHGGGFIIGSAATHRELAARISSSIEARVLVLNYRLAPEHPFPAALHDAVGAYRWLLDAGFRSDGLAVGGDSAGGGLTLQTLLALRDEGVPLPAAAFLLSPCTDWLRFDGESYSSRADADPYVTLEACRFTAAQYVGRNDPALPMLSPLEAELSGLPPLCIHVGDDEVLLSDSARLADRARAAGVEVELSIWPGMWHVFQASARLVPEARRSLEEIGRFVSARMG
jgi:acetyl esterase/lipase